MYPPEPNSIHRKLIMEKGFLDKVEDNAAVRTWAEAVQREKGDSLAERYVSELWDFTRISNLKDIILAHPDTKKKIDVFVLSIYGLVIFPRLWDMLMRQSLTCSTDLIRGSRQFRRFWRKHSGH
ncbi:hypothetical protein Gotur_024089 [Gossypium turneri]